MSWLKRRLPAKRWKRVFIYISSVILILLAADIILTQYWRRIEIGYDTTRLTGPLNAQGFPDYVAYLDAKAREGVTPGNNAAPELFRIVGTPTFTAQDEKAQHWRDHVLAKMGMTTEEFPSRVTAYVDWSKLQPAPTTGRAMTDDEAYDEQIQMVGAPWKSAEHPRWVRWLAEHREVIPAAHKALEKPHYYVPYETLRSDRLFTTVLPNLARLQALSLVLISEAMCAAGDGDDATCEMRLADALKLSRLLVGRQFIIETLNGARIYSEAARAVQHAAADRHLPPQVSRRLLQMLDDLPPAGGLAKAIDGAERMFELDAFCAVAANGTMEWMLAEGRPTTSGWLTRTALPIPYNHVLRRVNAYFDQIRETYREPSFKVAQAKRKAIAVDLEKRSDASLLSKATHPSNAIADLFMSLLTPSLNRAQELEEQMFVERDLARLALALRIYREEQGHYPETLMELSPSPLGEIPMDAFADQPMIYRREGAGFLLYSVGPNEKDDGGAIRSQKNPKNWDIVVRASE